MEKLGSYPACPDSRKKPDLRAIRPIDRSIRRHVRRHDPCGLPPKGFAIWRCAVGPRRLAIPQRIWGAAIVHLAWPTKRLFAVTHSSTEDAGDGLLLAPRNQVQVAPVRLFAEVTDPLLEHPLVHAVCGADADERVPKHVPALEDLPLRVLDEPLEMVVGLIVCERAGGHHSTSPTLLAAKDDGLLAKQVLAARVPSKPRLKHGLQKRRQGHATGRTLALHLLLFADERRATFQVNVVNQHAKQLRPPCPGVGGKRDHRVEKRLVAVCLGVRKEVGKLWLGKKQAVPQLGLGLRIKPAAGDLPLNLLAGLKRLLLVSLGVGKPPAGEVPLKEPRPRCPVPGGPQGGDFLPERGWRDLLAPRALSPGPLVEVALQVLARKRLHNEPLAKKPDEVVG